MLIAGAYILAVMCLTLHVIHEGQKKKTEELRCFIIGFLQVVRLENSKFVILTKF